MNRRVSSLEASFPTRVFYVWALAWGTAVTIVATTGYLITQLLIHRPSVFLWWTKIWATSVLGGMGIRIDCRWIGKLDENTPYVFAGNHQILLDIPLVALSVNRPFGFVAKGELASVPFLGAAIKYSPSIFVDRSNARKTYESIRVAGEQIRGGTSVVIFPEGARSYERKMGPFQKGAFALALEAGVPVVPVTIVDAYNVFNEKRKLARPGIVNVIIGEPISLSSYTRSDIPEIMIRVKRAIESQLPTDEFVGGNESDDTDARDVSDAIP